MILLGAPDQFRFLWFVALALLIAQLIPSTTDAKTYGRFSREVALLRKRSFDANGHTDSPYKQLKEVINETDYYVGSEDLENVTDYLEYLPDYYEGDIIDYDEYLPEYNDESDSDSDYDEYLPEYNDESDSDSDYDFSDYYGSDSDSSDSDDDNHTPDYYSINDLL